MTQKPRGVAQTLLPLALIALGVALLAVAVLVPLYSEDQLATMSLSDRTELVSTSQAPAQDAPGSDQEFPAQVLDRCSVSADKAAVYDAQISLRTFLTVEEPSGEHTATLQAGTSVIADKVKSHVDGSVSTPPLVGNNPANPTGPDRPGGAAAQPGCEDRLLLATIDRVTVDRRGGYPVADGISEVQMDMGRASLPLPNRTGQQYRFPFGTSAGAHYDFFDLTASAAFPVTYVEDSEIGDLKTLHFHVDVPESDLAYAGMPAGQDKSKWQFPAGTSLSKAVSWWGVPEASGQSELELHRFYKNSLELYVEPASGVIVRERQDLHEYFAVPVSARDGAPSAVKAFTLPVFTAVLDNTQDTVQVTTAQAKSYRDQIALLSQTIPISSAVLGLVLLVGGGVIYYRLTFRQ